MSNKKLKKNIDKQPIKIWEKPLNNGNKSLVLKFWDGKKWKYEFLKRYIVPEKNPFDKQNNKEARAYAQTVRAQRIIEMANNISGLQNRGKRDSANLIEYIQLLADKKKQKNGTERGTYLTYTTLIYHIKQYSGEATTFKKIDKTYCIGFIDYLKTAQNTREGGTLKTNTQSNYLKTLNATLNEAVADEILPSNPLNKIKQEDKPQKKKNEIIYLMPSEIKTLINTPYQCNQHVREAFLFACLTGLRYSDIKSLTWGNFRRKDNGDVYINYTQKKTDNLENLNIAEIALGFLPKRPDNATDADCIFKLSTNGYTNIQLACWCKIAEIKKKITFHTARHTAATALLSNGVAIETISNILGHSTISTTQNYYAEVIDSTKRAAVNTLNKIFDNL